VFKEPMPLIEGCSVKAAKENFEKLLEDGYSSDQAYAIAFSKARKNMRKCSSERQEEIKKGELMG